MAATTKRQLEVLEAVVLPIAVAVMNALIAGQRSMETARHGEPVLSDWRRAAGEPPVLRSR